MTDRPPPDGIPHRDDVTDESLDERLDPDIEPEPGDDAEVEPPGTNDPDVEAGRARAPTQDPKTLTTEQLRPEEELTEYEPPFAPTPETASGVTAADERAGETLDERLAQEQPDVLEGAEESEETDELEGAERAEEADELEGPEEFEPPGGPT